MPHTSDQADSSSNATAAEATTAARQAQCSKAAQDRPVRVVAAKPSRNAPRKMEWMSLPNSAVDRRAPALKRIDRIDRLPVSLLFPVARDAWRSMAPYGPPPPGSHSDATRKRPSLSSRVTRVRERERERSRERRRCDTAACAHSDRPHFNGACVVRLGGRGEGGVLRLSILSLQFRVLHNFVVV